MKTTSLKILGITSCIMAALFINPAQATCVTADIVVKGAIGHAEANQTHDSSIKQDAHCRNNTATSVTNQIAVDPTGQGSAEQISSTDITQTSSGNDSQNRTGIKGPNLGISVVVPVHVPAPSQ